MDKTERRKLLVEMLKQSAGSPVSGAQLADCLGVSRQVIVQDVAVLRAKGQRIVATPRGYTLSAGRTTGGITRLFAVRHGSEKTRTELYAAVDRGVEVVDVIVEHPVYGQLTGQLSLRTRADVEMFLQTMDQTGAGLLSSLTDGVHLHTVRADSREKLTSLEDSLKKQGILLTE